MKIMESIFPNLILYEIFKNLKVPQIRKLRSVSKKLKEKIDKIFFYNLQYKKLKTFHHLPPNISEIYQNKYTEPKNYLEEICLFNDIQLKQEKYHRYISNLSFSNLSLRRMVLYNLLADTRWEIKNILISARENPFTRENNIKHVSRLNMEICKYSPNLKYAKFLSNAGLSISQKEFLKAVFVSLDMNKLKEITNDPQNKVNAVVGYYFPRFTNIIIRYAPISFISYLIETGNIVSLKEWNLDILIGKKKYTRLYEFCLEYGNILDLRKTLEYAIKQKDNKGIKILKEFMK